MKKKKCDTCGKTFSRPTERQAQQALQGHLISAHRENIKPDSELTERQRKKREYNRWYNSQRRQGVKGADLPLRSEDAPKKKLGRPLKTPEQLKARRSYLVQYRKRKKMAMSRNGAMTGAARFCPHCGMNLEVLATAMAVVNKV